MDEGQCPQVVRITQGVGAVVAQIGAQAVVDGGATKDRQDPDLCGRLRAALDVRGIVRQLSGAGHVQPLSLAGDIPAGFVKMPYRSLRYALLNRGFNLGQFVGAHPRAACRVPSAIGCPSRSSKISQVRREGRAEKSGRW